MITESPDSLIKMINRTDPMILGDVTFEQDSDFTFETKGTFTLTKDVEIKLGAQLKVIPSEINY